MRRHWARDRTVETAAEARPKPLRLSYNSADAPVIVEPANGDRFFTTVREAAIACQAADKQAQFWEQVKEVLLPRLTRWLHSHQTKVNSAFLAVREGGLLLLVVKGDSAYDRAFEDELTALDLEIARNEAFNLIAIDITAIPLVSKITVKSYLGSGGILAEFRG